MLVTSLTIASDRRLFCSSDFPGQSFTMTWGIDLVLRRYSEIFFVGDLLHPGDVLAVERLLDRNVRHRFARRRAVPVLLVGRAPQHVTGVELEDWAALHLRPADAFGDDQGLAERMRVPGSA